ncbi:serine/threonine-protein kinase [Frateuria sp. STR12]|uniref:serine/threonine-protein kinase n=1 Tax=Frateuria hangzhouensis TaxID=2995589 RepID=UPI002260A85E|nr:serine/threonine-protein kinase [Frateuria sp. STR12]MCX7513975.1 protein kinase [Frateuria sp. STR12]
MAGQLTDRYVEAKRIAMVAMDVDASARDALIDGHVGEDAELAREVRWMLEAIERTHTATLPFAPAAEPPDLSGQQTQATAPRNYRILRLLGEGGMGMVYLAERCNEGFSQQVALKFLHAANEGSPILHERFSQERRLLARLEHPGIARLLDGGVMDSGRPFLAMEYVEGLRIDEWCDAHSLSLNERLVLFLKVCDAVEFAHRNLVIHRDIKPANILVTADGMPKLLDFGIARIIEEGGQVLATATAAHALTLAYASPEQIEQQPLTTGADVYSLGVVLYQLIAGRRPYQHLVTPHLLSNAIVGGQVLAPSRTLREAPADRRRPWRSIPADIDAIVLKALRRQVSQRYASVGEFAEDLRFYLARRPVRARRGRQWYRLRRFAQRNRWPLAAAGMVLAAALAGLTASLLALAQTRAAQRLAEQRQHDLERMVDFQQSMLQSVDIDAMGHALTHDERALVLARFDGAAGKTIDRTQLEQAFAGIAASGPAREALDAYVVSHALARLDKDFADAPLLAADLRQSLARVLLTIGSYAHAATELRQVVRVRQERLSDGDAALVSARVDLGEALYRDGQLEQAAAVYGNALPAVKKLPQADPMRVAALSGHARVLSAQGHLKQALDQQQTLYAGLAAHLPATDEGLLRLRRDRVETLTQLGKRDRARAELEQLVPLYQQTFGIEHPETLATTLTLASLLYSQDNEYERSLALAQDVAAIRERRLGSDHPLTLQARGLAASNEVRLALDPTTMAQVHERLAALIRAYRRVQGADNRHTLDAMTDMVRLLSKQDRYPEAIAMERQIVAGRTRTLGADHFSTLYARGSLASLLCGNGQYAEASAEGERVLAALRRQFGDDHPMTLATYDLIGRIETGAGRWPLAREAHARALEGRARTLGDTDAHTIESASRLYAVLLKLHDDASAKHVFATYLQPVIAMDPGSLNAGMRSVREEALAAVGPQATSSLR